MNYTGVLPRAGLFKPKESTRLQCAGDQDGVVVEDDSTRFHNMGDVDALLTDEDEDDIDIDNLPVD
jgi:hypothetical protein